MVDLGTLDADSDALDVNSAALDINTSGKIVGHSTTSSGEHHAFLWDPATATMRDLGTLGGSYSEAHGINDRGEVTGVSSTATGLIRSFLWSPESGEMHDLGANRRADEDYSAHKINNSPTIVGLRAGGTSGFIWWNDDRDLQDLGDLLALDINNGGLIVGTRLTTDPSATHLPFVRSGSTGTTVELPGITGTTEGAAHAINDAGVIVGLVSARDPQVGPRPVRWSPATS